MSLTIVKTKQEQPVSGAVLEALRSGIAACGSAVLLVPSISQALAAQKALARESGLSLAVTVTTPSSWIKERWEVWGDGRTVADATALAVLARQILAEATASELGPIEPSLGVVQLLSQLVGQALPWLPLDEKGCCQQERCRAAGLTTAETLLIGLAGKLSNRLAAAGFVSAAEVSVLVPRMLRAQNARMSQVVVAGFTSMGRRELELVRALSALTELTLVVRTCEGPAAAEVERLAACFGVPVQEEQDVAPYLTGASETQSPQNPLDSTRVEGLCELLSDLFCEQGSLSANQAPVELLLPAGPVAEAELVAQRVCELVDELAQDVATADQEGNHLVIAVPDVSRAWRELVPKLVARGISVQASWSDPLSGRPAARAFFSFAQTVAHLAELAQSWPEPVVGLDGPMQRLGDMSWWPPRELVDFLLSDMAHVPPERAWRLDAAWRGNRLLTPARVLEMLQSEGETSAPVARATAELLRGRIGSAASKLLAPYVMQMGEKALAMERDESRAVLQAIIQLAGTLRELGLTADPSIEGALSLSELVELCEWAAEGCQLSARPLAMGATAAHESDEHPVTVRLASVSEASGFEPCSADVLVVCGLTTAEQPVGAEDNLLRALLEQLGVEEPVDPMARARSSFRTLISVPRRCLVLERTLHDADAQPTYPSVMLAELLAVYGGDAQHAGEGKLLAQMQRPETDLARNLSVMGTVPRRGVQDEPAPAGRLTAQARELVFVPQAGKDRLPDGKPVLSASQVETYLDCPYKWFSLRRLRLGQVDAGHTGMEMGTFAHRVLEVTHRELLARALEQETPGVPREELLAAIEADPSRHVSGSRVESHNLEAAQRALDLEFDLHQQHMYMVRRPRQIQQLLIAHDSIERAQEEQLRQDLLSSLSYQTRILKGFEPRLFEWSFGRHELVEYAGAYFTGTVDRIDVSPHGTAVIIDYKHKSPAGFAAEYDALQEGVLEGQRLPNRVQSLIYAQVVRRAFEGRLRLVGTTYLSTKSPHALAGAADEGVADLVFGKLSAVREGRVCVPRTSEGAPGMNALLDRTEELVAEQVEQMMAGNVDARPRDRRSCDYCPVMQCERRVAR